MTKDIESQDFVKIIYFDETAASDYVTIKNGGKIEWTKNSSQKKNRSAEGTTSASVGAGFRFLNIAKAAFSGEIKASADINSSKVIENIFSNALLTDYITLATQDENIQKYSGKSVFVPENSLTQYKLMSSVVDLISPEQFKEYGFNIDKLNSVILDKHGYYQMLLGHPNKIESILRFNISSFKNNYNLSDIPKMNLNYFAVKVGRCSKEDLTFESEFDVTIKKTRLTGEDIVNGKSVEEKGDFLDIYDVILAGVIAPKETK